MQLARQPHWSQAALERGAIERPAPVRPNEFPCESRYWHRDLHTYQCRPELAVGSERRDGGALLSMRSHTREDPVSINSTVHRSSDEPDANRPSIRPGHAKTPGRHKTIIVRVHGRGTFGFASEHPGRDRAFQVRYHRFARSYLFVFEGSTSEIKPNLAKEHRDL